MQKGITTRLVSHKILFNLKKNILGFDEILDKYILKYSLSSRDKNMIYNIVLTSMRYDLYVKKIIAIYIKKKLNINQYLLLLSAITQMIFLDFKDYAVINTTVEIAKNKNIKVYPGFINAVLKNILKDKEKIKYNKIEFNDLPHWFTKETTNWEDTNTKKFLQSIIQKPDLHLVFKNIKSLNLFNYKSIKTSKISLTTENTQIDKLPRFEKGEWWIQDYSSMLPILLTPNINNKQIIDMCAAPGGKTFQLLSQNANLDIVEINPLRANVLKENLNRLKYTNKIHIKDSLKINENKKYDIVLIDAPCSSIGTIRRNPEIFFRNNSPNFEQLISLQKKLLEKAKKILKKKGIIIYVVCSFLEQETVNQIQLFLKNNYNFQIKKFHLEKDTYSLIDSEGFINIIPKKIKNVNIDGFFAAKLINND